MQGVLQSERKAKMSRFINKRFSRLAAYVPGEQPKDMEYIKLNTNESPFPPSPETVRAISEEEVKKLNLYSDPSCAELKAVLAEKNGVFAENVFVSNGSDDILNFSFMAFAGYGEEAIFPDITYGFYEVFCELHGINYKKIPLDNEFKINVEDYFGNDSFIAIANPNAPTGLILSMEKIEEILKKNPDRVVLIDEAYIDFGGESCVPLTKKYDNLLVVQTFSKSKNLAGARLGFAIGNKGLIEDLEKIKYSTNPYSINRLSMAAGIAAVKSSAYYDEKCHEIEKVREFTKDGLEKLGFLVIDSKANFLFAKKEGLSGKEFYEKLREKGVLVRHFNAPRICEFNRITIGTKEQMNRFLEIAKEICC